MNVFHLITTIERGGAETQLLTLVRQQVLEGKKVTVAYLKGSPALSESLISVGAKVLYDLANRNPLRQVFILRSKLKNGDFILHSHLPRAELIASLSGNLRQVVSRHNTEHFFPSAPTLISRILSSFVLTKAGACIAISNAVKAFLEREGEIPSETSVHVVHYGINKRQYHHEKISKLNSSIRIGTISRLVPQKNLTLMLDGFKLFHEKNSSATLGIVGKGVNEHLLKTYANNLGIGRSVIWTSEISDVPGYLRGINIFCLTSNYEGFGLVLLESMASGIPIVAKANEATIEVLGSDYPYLISGDDFVALSNAFSELSNPDKSAEVVARNYKRLENFTDSVMEKKISDVYYSI